MNTPLQYINPEKGKIINGEQLFSAFGELL